MKIQLPSWLLPPDAEYRNWWSENAIDVIEVSKLIDMCAFDYNVLINIC